MRRVHGDTAGYIEASGPSTGFETETIDDQEWQGEVEISKNGTAVKRQRTDAPFGVVTLSTILPAGGAPRQTEYQVNGSVKFATLSMTTESGDIEQQLVPIPFSKTFFTKAGTIVGLSAAKTRVMRPDPLSLHESMVVVDDGVRGSVHVIIRVNGTAIGEADASEPYGLANTTVRIP